VSPLAVYDMLPFQEYSEKAESIVIVVTLILLRNAKAGMRTTRVEQEINQQIIEYDNHGHISDVTRPSYRSTILV
jgi:hypothetical protein